MTSIFKTIECKKHKEIPLEGGYAICIRCGTCRPSREENKVPMRPIHFVILQELRESTPQFFYRNRTAFFYEEVFRYIYEKKVVRVTIMGETRGGKSEEAQTIGINYARIFNALLAEGHFKEIDIFYKSGKKMPVTKVFLDVQHVHANQSAYLYHLRDMTRAEELVFGQIHIIDEDRDNPGGIGSFSEEMETMNLNNIVAKFLQSELWIRPRSFQEVNAPFGLNCFIKDEKNRTNWSLLYKLEMNSAGLRAQNFLGWVGIGLHVDQKLRDDYQQKKNTWIEQELSGAINERATRRMRAIEKLLADEFLTQHVIGKDGRVRWKHGIETMSFLVEKAMMNQEIDNFNETEIERIVHGIRALGEKNLVEKGRTQ